jgi:hypothetical protein
MPKKPRIIIAQVAGSGTAGVTRRAYLGDDEAALLRLWREKRGEVEPEDLSGNLIVQLGTVTEGLNRRWYGQASIGHDHAAGVPGARRRAVVPPTTPVLAAEQSAPQRDRLLAELGGLRSNDEAAIWAHQSLPAKNTLTVADAQLVEEGFRIRLSALGDEEPGMPSEGAEDLGEAQLTMPNPAATKPLVAPSSGPGIRRGQVAAKTIRLRDKDHRRFVSTQPCLVCGRSPAEAHHLRFAQPRALSRKVSDEFTVPLCRVHHRELHRHGAEVAWWQSIKIDPLPVAHRLWQHARRNGTTEAVEDVTEPKSSIATNGAGTGSLAPKSDPAGEPRPDGRAIT